MGAPCTQGGDVTVAACQCAACGRPFTGIEAFDRHQRWIGGVLTCADPAGLARLDGSPLFEREPRRGYWRLTQTPGRARRAWYAPGGPRMRRESV
jgi:hypothetical protein